MPKQSYKLREGSTLTVDVEWTGLYKDFRVRAEGRELGVLHGQDALVRGASWPLSDGSTLAVRLRKAAFLSELELLHDGVPVPGSPTDPKTGSRDAAMLTFLIAGINLVLGLAAVLGELQFLRERGLGYEAVAFGAVFLALGFAVRKGSIAALIATIMLFAVDGILGVAMLISEGVRPPTGGIVFRLIMLIGLIRCARVARGAGRG
ncbi:MAG: hypothetical protein IPK80_11695 [Nannocystis sp.]|nr:hypothetical protein [Nannocystis sp.]